MVGAGESAAILTQFDDELSGDTVQLTTFLGFIGNGARSEPSRLTQDASQSAADRFASGTAGPPANV